MKRRVKDLNNVSQIVASNVKQLRDEARLTQEELAEMAGVPLRSYQNLEQGHMWHEKKTAEAVARALKVTTARLYVAESPEMTVGDALHVIEKALSAAAPKSKEKDPESDMDKFCISLREVLEEASEEELKALYEGMSKAKKKDAIMKQAIEFMLFNLKRGA